MVSPGVKLKDFRRWDSDSLGTRKVTLVCIEGVQAAAQALQSR